MKIVFNMSNIGDGALAGPGHHAVRLFDEIAAMIDADLYPGLSITGFVQRGGEHHFTPAARRRLRFLPRFGGRVTRTLYEQAIFPFIVAPLRADILLNTAFTGPIWGARRIVTIVHDLYFRVVPSMVETQLRRFLTAMVPICARFSWKVITISQSSAADIARYYPFAAGKVVVTLLGSKYRARADTPMPAAGPRPPLFLMVANMTANKNPDVVIDAAARLRRDGIDVRLTHVGADNLGLVAAAVRKHDAADWFVRETGISDARLAELYGTVTALVVASYYEGFCMPVLEAQSLGVPVICSDRSALPEVAGDAALYFDPDRADALADRMRLLASDDTERASLREAGFTNVARFSWEKTARDTLRHLGVAAPTGPDQARPDRMG